MDPTNAQLMKTLDALADKMDLLPNRNDLKQLEDKLTCKMHEQNREIARKTQDNTRDIRALKASVEQQQISVQKITEQLSKQPSNKENNSVAEYKRREARDDKYAKARRSFRIWPVERKDGEEIGNAVRRFFHEYMGVPTELAYQAEFEKIKPSLQGHPRSKIRAEYVITFVNTETRDTIKSYARGLADWIGKAGLRLELMDALRGSYRILEEHGRATRELYGEGTKRNVRFDDRNMDLMMDLKLPSSNTWHNITDDQARRTKEMRDQLELKTLKRGQRGSAHNRERAKVLMIEYSPDVQSPRALMGGTNLINIESSFGAAEPSEEQPEEDGDSDESMERLLHGRPRRGTSS